MWERKGRSERERERERGRERERERERERDIKQQKVTGAMGLWCTGWGKTKRQKVTGVCGLWCTGSDQEVCRRCLFTHTRYFGELYLVVQHGDSTDDTACLPSCLLR